MVIFVTVSVLFDQILYSVSPVCRPMFIEDRTKFLFSIILLLLISTFPYMMVSPKFQSYRRTILDSSPQFFYFPGQEFLFCLISYKFSISSSTCITFYLQVIILYIVSILSPLIFIFVLQETSYCLLLVVSLSDSVIHVPYRYPEANYYHKIFRINLLLLFFCFLQLIFQPTLHELYPYMPP